MGIKWYIPGLRRLNTFAQDIPPAYYVRVYCELPIPYGQPFSYWTDGNYMKTKLSVCSTFTTSRRWVPGTLEVYLGGEKVVPTSQTNTESTWTFTLSTSKFPEDNYLWVSYTPYGISYVSATELPASAYATDELFIPSVDASSIVALREIVNSIESALGIPHSRWVGGISNMTLGGPRNIYNGITPVLAEHIRGIQEAIKVIEEVVDSRLPEGLFQRTEFTEIHDEDQIRIEHIRECVNAIERVVSAGGITLP